MSAEQPVIILRPGNRWRWADVRELVRYRDLLYFLVVRGIRARYAQSVLGVGWAVIQPLLSTVIFTVVFGSLAKIDSDGEPYFLFSLSAMVPWVYFSSTLTEAANSMITHASLITKVYFPRLILPLSAVLSKFLDFIISFVLLMFIMMYYGRMPGLNWLFLPFLLVILLFTSLGMGLILASLAVQYRDVKYALTFMVQILMYLSPVIYPLSSVPDRYIFVYTLNPMAGVIEGFRSCLLAHQPFPWMLAGKGLLVACLLLLAGLAFFQKMERKFADVA